MSACLGSRVSAYRVEAAYIYNFAKFIEWPAQNFHGSTVPMQFCVLRDHLFELELSRILKDKTIAGRALQVVQVEDGEQSRHCQVLFINSSERKVEQVIEAVQGTSVLTLGETENFLKQGGIIHFVLENDRVQFEINHKAANKAGLYISSRLLAVARQVAE